MAEAAYDPGYGAAPNPNSGAPQPYGQPYPAPGQYAPPQQPMNPPAGPPLPPGWVAQFDQTSQRWYYIEQATGISRWEPPSNNAPYGQYPPPQVPHYGGATGAYPQPDPYYGGQNPGMAPPAGGGYYPQGQVKDPKSDKDDKKKMMMGAAGGLAVGAVGGALVGHALGGSSNLPTHSFLPSLLI